MPRLTFITNASSVNRKGTYILTKIVAVSTNFVRLAYKITKSLYLLNVQLFYASGEVIKKVCEIEISKLFYVN